MSNYSLLGKWINRIKPDRPVSGRGIYLPGVGSVPISEHTAMCVSAFYRGVIYLSTQLAKLPWEVKDAQNNPLPNSPIWYLLNAAPNNETTAYHFKTFMIQCALVHGNGYAEIERSLDGRVTNIWQLDPRRVCPERDVNGRLWYRVTEGANQASTYLKPSDVLIFRNPHTLDGIHGLSMIGYATQILGISFGADRVANALYANGGMPSGVLTHPGKMSGDAAERLKKTWREKHGGNNSGGTVILEEGMKYEPLSYSPEVLQFLGTRKFNVSEIARFLGLPPTKLFDADSSKYNNIEHANLEVVNDTFDTWAINLQSEADIKLLADRRSGRHTKMDLYELSRGDMDTRAQYYQRMQQSGAITANEIRRREGMAPYEGGDTFYIATNNLTPADKVQDLVDSQIEKNRSAAKPEPASPVDEAVAAYLGSKVK